MALLLVILTAIVVSLFLFLQTGPTHPDQLSPHISFDRSRIQIVRSGTDAALLFEVEVARTPEQHARGLMFRDKVPAGTGMLFVFDSPQKIIFWMKNTRVPLDLLFVRDSGMIESIIEKAEPLSLAPLASVGPVVSVLEIAGGEAQRLGIKPGDTLRSMLNESKI